MSPFGLSTLLAKVLTCWDYRLKVKLGPLVSKVRCNGQLPDFLGARINQMETSFNAGLIEGFHLWGTSYPEAPVEVRERLAVHPDMVGPTARLLTEPPGIQEAVILSTRLRSEFYIWRAEPTNPSELDGFLSQTFGIDPPHFQPFLYFLSGEEAVRHLFRVAAGLDSLIPGENQAREAAAEALAASAASGAAGPTLQRIFQAVLQCGRRVGAETRLGRRNLSLGQAVVEMVEKIFGSLDSRTVLLLGGGQTFQLAARDLQRVSAERIWVASPVEQEARDLVHKLGVTGTRIPWEHLREAMDQADVVIHSSSSQRPVLQRSEYERIRSLRQKRPLFLLDLSVPRAIDPSLDRYGEVFLYNIDDMAPIAAAHSRRYETEIRAAEALVRTESDRFLQRLQEDPLSHTMLALERQLERIRQEQLVKNRATLRGLTVEQRQDVERLTSAITRKIFYEVANELKQSSSDGDGSKLPETLSLVLGLI